jgi:hypothetical protein
MEPSKKRLKLWVEALRSDRYKQGRGRMRCCDEYCVLGVGVDVALRNGVKMDVLVRKCGCHVYDGYANLMPDSVQAWYGLQSNPEVKTAYGKCTLMRLNDIERHPFAKLADYIEKTYLEDE